MAGFTCCAAPDGSEGADLADLGQNRLLRDAQTQRGEGQAERHGEGAGEPQKVERGTRSE